MKWIIHLNILILSVAVFNMASANIVTDFFNSFTSQTIKRKKLAPVQDQKNFNHLLMSSEGK